MKHTPHGDPVRSENATPDAVAVSIIIPACNAADSIDRCIDSVQRQNLAAIEIIVVDDGSQDETPRIVEDRLRAQPEANIRVQRQTNQGVSVARNVGLAMARGRYVMFIDADDRLADGMLGALQAQADRDALQVLLCNAWWHDLAGHPPRLMLPDGAHWLAWSAGCAGRGRDWIVQRVAERRMKHYVWCQFIRRDWLMATGIRFVPGITHQDIVWTNRVLGAATRVGFTAQPAYHYHQRAGSLSQPRDSAARLRTARHYLRVARELDALAWSTRHEPLRAAYAWQSVEEGIAVLHAVRHLEPTDRERLFRSIQSSGHAALLLRNALGARHKLRVMKRCMRYLAWRAGEAAILWLRRGATAPGKRGTVAAINTQFGSD